MICNVTNLPNQTVEKQTNNMSFKMAVRKPAPQHIDRYINVLGLSEESRGFFNNILLFKNYFTSSLNFLPAENAGTVLAAIFNSQTPCHFFSN